MLREVHKLFSVIFKDMSLKILQLKRRWYKNIQGISFPCKGKPNGPPITSDGDVNPAGELNIPLISVWQVLWRCLLMKPRIHLMHALSEWQRMELCQFILGNVVEEHYFLSPVMVKNYFWQQSKNKVQSSHKIVQHEEGPPFHFLRSVQGKDLRSLFLHWKLLWDTTDHTLCMTNGIFHS